MSNFFDKLSTHPHIRGTRWDDCNAVMLYVLARFELRGGRMSALIFLFLSACRLIQTCPEALAFPSFEFFIALPHKLTFTGPLRSNRAGFLLISIKNERTQRQRISYFSLIFRGWGRFFSLFLFPVVDINFISLLFLIFQYYSSRVRREDV